MFIKKISSYEFASQNVWCFILNRLWAALCAIGSAISIVAVALALLWLYFVFCS